MTIFNSSYYPLFYSDKTVMIMNPNLGDKLISSNTDNMLSSYSAADDQQGEMTGTG